MHSQMPLNQSATSGFQFACAQIVLRPSLAQMWHIHSASTLVQCERACVVGSMRHGIVFSAVVTGSLSLVNATQTIGNSDRISHTFVRQDARSVIAPWNVSTTTVGKLGVSIATPIWRWHTNQRPVASNYCRPSEFGVCWLVVFENKYDCRKLHNNAPVCMNRSEQITHWICTIM